MKARAQVQRCEGMVTPMCDSACPQHQINTDSILPLHSPVVMNVGEMVHGPDFNLGEVMSAVEVRIMYPTCHMLLTTGYPIVAHN